MRTHEEIDMRSLALHRLVVAKIRRDGALFDKAQAILRRWHQTASPRTHGYLDTWQGLMDRGIDVCLSAATDESEWGDSIRQASPFACLLTNQERFAFLKQWRESHAPQ